MKHVSYGSVKIPIIPAYAVPALFFFCFVFYLHVALIKKERKKKQQNIRTKFIS